MNLVRHEAGFSTTENRFPTKGTCLAIYSHCVNAELAIEEVLGKTFPWCSSWSVELKELFGAYVEAKQAQNVLDYDDLLLYWAQMLGDRLAFPRKDKLSARGTDSSNPLCSGGESANPRSRSVVARSPPDLAAGKDMMRRRKALAEHPFGTLKCRGWIPPLPGARV